MSKERSQRQPPLAALDEKSQSEPRPEPSASALVEHGDSRRPSVSVNEGDLGSMPPVGEHPRKSLGSLDFGDSGPEKSDPLTAAPVSGDNVDIAKEFLEGIWDAYYDGVKSGGDYFDRYVSASRVHYQNYLLSTNVTQRHRPLAEFIFPSRIVDLKLLSGPARENVFYDSRDNTLILPAGALQPPYYDSNSPLGLVFGGLGTLIARDLVNELFHTPEGVLKEDQSKNVFSRKSQCLLDEMMKGMASNASLDSSSVITDVFTLRVAFEGYHIFMGTEEDNTLQGVAELTPDQLFFISAVRTLCTNIRERHFAQVVLLKKSVTEMKLIDTAVMQMREFDDTFHCEKKDSATLKQNFFNKCVYTSS
ncbi:conserved hypothetical protein [Ixodes scapularis]|uniref:Peptidase M13 C-terminal domain-containing protein n=1 Tax=Ixodes scapularis TaxID=6945 RepID=B7PYA2_IXOSC|nr:conserved hypothetical protein [Ixodes scapularis]|eukprot:XP_002402756.1 conserved hypothetical protein [Ixodes scapularis]